MDNVIANVQDNHLRAKIYLEECVKRFNEGSCAVVTNDKGEIIFYTKEELDNDARR